MHRSYKIHRINKRGTVFYNYEVIVEIGKKKYLKTTSFDLDSDHSGILKLAEGKGYFSPKDNKDIPEKRFNIALQNLIDQGFVWLDEYKGEKTYYVCAMFNGFN